MVCVYGGGVLVCVYACVCVCVHVCSTDKHAEFINASAWRDNQLAHSSKCLFVCFWRCHSRGCKFVKNQSRNDIKSIELANIPRQIQTGTRLRLNFGTCSIKLLKNTSHQKSTKEKKQDSKNL